MKFVCSGAYTPAADLRSLAGACEEAGFEAITLSDHLVHPKKLRTPYPYTPDGQPRWEPFTPWPDPWVAIASMAAVTERLHFFTSVYVLPMRSPVQVAKTVATVAALAPGRIALGLGAGWMREEFALAGVPFERRGARMNEAIEVIRKLFAGGPGRYVEHHGEFYDFDPLEMSPLPPEPVPIWVGGFSVAAKRRVARLADGWISDLHTTEELAGHLADIRVLRAEAGRAELPFDVVAAASDAYTIDGYRRLEDLGATHIMTLPWTLVGLAGNTLAEKREGVMSFGEKVIAKMAS